MSTFGSINSATDVPTGTAVVLLSTTTGVNLKNTGVTSLYTVPTGKTAIITDIIPVVTAASGFAVAAAISIGKAAGYTEWAPITTLAGLSGIGFFVQLSTAALLPVRQTFAATEVIGVNVTTGATATTLTATFYVLGILV